MPMRALLTAVALVAHGQLANAEPVAPKCPGLTGIWAADVDAGVFHGPLALHVHTDQNGGLGAKMFAPVFWTERPNGGAVWNFRRDGQRVEFDIHGFGGRHWDLFPFRYAGRDPDWTYIGTVSADGSTIRGAWTQLGRKMPTDFECVGA